MSVEAAKKAPPSLSTPVLVDPIPTFGALRAGTGVTCTASRLIPAHPARHPRAAAPGRPTETSISEADGQERSRIDQLNACAPARRRRGATRVSRDAPRRRRPLAINKGAKKGCFGVKVLHKSTYG